MSAQMQSAGLAGGIYQPTNEFRATLVLAEGATAHITAPTLTGLQAIVGALVPTAAAANDTAQRKESKAAALKQAGPEPTSPESAATPGPTYDDVKARVLALSKRSRDLATSTLAMFTGPNGQPVDHGNKLKLEDYPAFLKAADEILNAPA